MLIENLLIPIGTKKGINLIFKYYEIDEDILDLPED